MVLKRKHFAPRILAAAMAVTMLGCWPVLAFAEEAAAPADSAAPEVTETPDAPDSVTVADSAVDLLGCPPSHPTGTTVELKKTVTLRADTFSPSTVFAFTVVPGAAVDATADSQPILAGIEGGLKMDGDGTVKFTADDPILYPAKSLSKTFKMVVNPNSFRTVGIYHYILKETAGDYDGMGYDTVQRDVYVYITNGKNNQPTYNSTVVMKQNTKTTEFVNDYTTHNLTVTKALTGNQAVMSAEFTFTVNVNGDAGEKYLVRKGNRSEFLKSSETGTIEVKLKNNESFTVYGLSPNDTYTVTEKGANTNGYTTTFDKVKANSKTGTISDDTTVACVNNRNANIPTGLAADMLPYAGMILLAVGCGVYLLRRKHEDEL